MGHAVAVSESSDEWQVWLNSLDPRGKAAAESLRARFEALGAADTGDWAKSEICEDLPHLARFMLLRSLWRGPIDGWSDPNALDQLPAAQRLFAAGANKEDLVRPVRAVAYEAVFATLDEFDSGSDVNVSGIDVGRLVMEAAEDGTPTGRPLSGLHEDLLGMDPSGLEGADLWQ